MRMEGELIQADFVKRKNRFSISVRKDGREFEAFLANLASWKILIPGRRLLLRRANGQRKTNFDAIAAFQGEDTATTDSRLPNALIKEALLAGYIPEFQGYRLAKAEPTYGAGKV
jgi:sugar fermentation stimulation protein A